MEYRKGVIFVILMGGKYLVSHAKGLPDFDWYFPGCGIEEGESIEEAFFREVYEELGLRKENFISYKNTGISYKYTWHEGLVKRTGFIGQEKVFFLGILTPGTNIDISITDELDGIKWLSWNELFDIIPHDNLKDVLRNNEDLFRI